jgi:serine/threonine protein kinase
VFSCWFSFYSSFCLIILRCITRLSPLPTHPPTLPLLTCVLHSTPMSMSTELCSGQPYNTNTDVWSLGCLLYELTTLRKTFEAQSLNLLIMKIMKSAFASIPHTYSRQLAVLIGQLLQKDAVKRASVNSILRMSYVMQRIPPSPQLATIRPCCPRLSTATPPSLPLDPPQLPPCIALRCSLPGNSMQGWIPSNHSCFICCFDSNTSSSVCFSRLLCTASLQARTSLEQLISPGHNR